MKKELLSIRERKLKDSLLPLSYSSYHAIKKPPYTSVWGNSYLRMEPSSAAIACISFGVIF
jgi:hypothetical protein